MLQRALATLSSIAHAILLAHSVAFVAGTYINVQTKKKALALRAKAQAKAEAETKDITEKK